MQPAGGKTRLEPSRPNGTPLQEKGPRYRHIADALVADIRAARYPLGSMLPTEAELCTRFGASRHTVREALRILARLGLITRRSGAGSTVVATSQRMILVPCGETVEPILNYPAVVLRRNLGTRFIAADAATARVLPCPIGAPWYLIREVRFSPQTQEPLGAFDIHVLPQYAGVTAHKNYLKIPVNLQIEQMFGVALGHAEVSITAGQVPPDLADVLKAPAGSPALRVVRRFYSGEGELFEVAVAVFPEGRYTYSLSFRREAAR